MSTTHKRAKHQQLQSSLSNPKRILNRCANLREETTTTQMPKNSLSLESTAAIIETVETAEVEDEAISSIQKLLNEINVRPRGTICKKRSKSSL
jgi:hypothetical protein